MMGCGSRVRATRWARRASASLACALAAAAAAQPPPARDGAAELRVGEPHVTAQRATDRFVYAAELAAGTTYLLRVEQQGLDLLVAVTAPDGSTATFNSPLLRDEAEVVLLDRREPGRYEVAVYSEEHTGAVGGHALELVELGAGVDPRELAAWRLMSSGALGNFAANEESWRAAVAAYEEAAELWRDAGNARGEAQGLLSVATLEFWQLYDWDRSAELAARAAELYAALGDRVLQASATQLRASALVERALEAGTTAAPVADAEALFANALAAFEQARSLYEPQSHRYEVGSIINNLGYVAYNRGQFDAARAYYQEAAALLRSAEEWGAELNPLANLAVLDAEAGQVAAAVDTFERILAILPPGKLERYRSDTLFNLGTSYRRLGDFERSLQTFAAALDIQQTSDDLQGRGRSLRGIGETYYAVGELELATQYLEQALDAAVATNDGRPQEGIYRILGNIAALTGDYTLALERHRQALTFATSTVDQTYLNLLIAKDLLALGRAAEAADLASRASESAAASGSDLLLATALHELGRAQAGSATPATAVGNLERAAALFGALDVAEQHADVLHSLAIVLRDQQQLVKANDYATAAVAELERLRIRVADPELRAAFGATRRNYYDTAVDILMRLQASAATDEYSRAAFAVTERSRARLTADLLQEASIDLRQNGDATLRARENALIERLAERRAQRDRLLQTTEGAADALPPVLADLAAIENELNLIEIELRRGNPRFASLTGGVTLSLEEIQALLDDDTVLLQYALGSRSSYVWAVTRERVTAVELAPRTAIEAAARRALEDLQTPAPNAAAGAPPSPAQEDLARLVLAPVAAALEHRQVLLALDGALQYVPFAALPVAAADGTAARLLVNHDVVVIPSFSALASMPARGAPLGKTLAVIADPVMTATDPRFLAPPATLVASLAPHTVAARSSVGPGLGRLLATGHEAESIAALVPDGQRLIARGFDASRDALLATDLRQYRYIHFATHGLVDSRYPGLSALALSQFDAQGAPQNGFLRLNDIYNLDLNADVVVLSACETALGRDIRGEGLIGLTQGFMYAGARTLVASLWQVPDRATAELMTLFYTHLLRDGSTPAAALRSAQIAIAAERRWSDPYYWSGFVLVGDWR